MYGPEYRECQLADEGHIIESGAPRCFAAKQRIAATDEHVLQQNIKYNTPHVSAGMFYYARMRLIWAFFFIKYALRQC